MRSSDEARVAADAGARARHCGLVVICSKLPAQILSKMKLALRNHLFDFQKLHKSCTVDQCANIHIIAQIAAK